MEPRHPPREGLELFWEQSQLGRCCQAVCRSLTPGRSPSLQGVPRPPSWSTPIEGIRDLVTTCPPRVKDETHTTLKLDVI